ncbi:single-stranded DNA-binding protein [Arthrobacter koreensis]|uniref:single-stranded DNA-binding protein n=1 Tax=Arthrobacter koreensis TaxID=199136 RepID=UPI0037F57192
MSNVANTGTLIGRLAKDPKAFMNTDGSRKVLFTLFVDRAYKGADNKTISDAISLEAFVGNKTQGLGPYELVHQGDLVAVNTHIEQMPYKAKDTGETVYPAPKIVIDEIKFLESRTVTQTRMARRTAETAPAAEGAAAQAAPADQGADYNNDAPFGAPVAG